MPTAAFEMQRCTYNCHKAPLGARLQWVGLLGTPGARGGAQCRNDLGPLGVCVGFHPAGAEGPQTATEACRSLPGP